MARYNALKRYYDEQSYIDPIHRRLAKEHVAIDSLIGDGVDIKGYHVSYEAIKKDYSPPLRFIIYYSNLSSIIGINDDKYPILGSKHKIEFDLTDDYPFKSARCKTLSKVWHPNIKWDGPLEGRICTNDEGFGQNFSLEMMILRIGEILQYKNYHAENTPPYPEDEKVAAWVRDIAEPKGWVSKTGGILLGKYQSVEGILDSSIIQEPEKKKIVIKSKKTSEDGHQNEGLTLGISTERKKITIRPKD